MDRMPLNNAMRMGSDHASWCRSEDHSIRTESQGTRETREKATGSKNQSPYKTRKSK